MAAATNACRVGRTALLAGWPYSSMPLSLQFWYPAAPVAPVATRARRAHAACRVRPRSWTQRLRSFRRGFEDVADADAALAVDPVRLPLVLYFPGWPGTAVDNRFLIAKLARHGYAVAAVTYHGGHPGSRLELDYSSESACLRTLALAQERVTSRAADAGALLDELTRLQAEEGSHPLFRRLDLNRVGVAGFSFGGAVAAETATRDVRAKAAVNIDGRHWGNALQDGVARPYLFIGEELTMPTADDLSSTQSDRRHNALLDQRDYSQLAKNLQRHGGVKVTIEGSRHMNFTDGALRRGLRRVPDTGRVEPRRVLEIVAAYVTDFFDHTLNGAGSTLLVPAPRVFAEAKVDVWKPGVTPPAESTPGRAC